MEALAGFSQRITGELEKVVVGQQELISQVLATMLCNGHALIEGVPGLAKTLTVKSVAAVLGVNFRRVQCTSDLMPADIIGTNIFETQTSSFRMHKGPLFTDLLLVDEINRMPPRTQAALLEAMEERQATIDGVPIQLSENFAVFATQNPVEFEGTYPLPEAQLDRFLMKIVVTYPGFDAELKIVDDHSGDSRATPSGITPIALAELQEARKTVNRIVVEAGVKEYAVRVARKTREWPAITLGASPRAAIAMVRVAKALAALDRRDYVIPDDVKKSAKCTLRHRIALNPEAELEGLTSDEAIEQVLRAVEVPK